MKKMNSLTILIITIVISLCFLNTAYGAVIDCAITDPASNQATSGTYPISFTADTDDAGTYPAMNITIIGVWNSSAYPNCGSPASTWVANNSVCPTPWYQAIYGNPVSNSQNINTASLTNGDPYWINATLNIYGDGNYDQLFIFCVEDDGAGNQGASAYGNVPTVPIFNQVPKLTSHLPLNNTALGLGFYNYTLNYYSLESIQNNAGSIVIDGNSGTWEGACIDGATDMHGIPSSCKFEIDGETLGIGAHYYDAVNVFNVIGSNTAHYDFTIYNDTPVGCNYGYSTNNFTFNLFTISANTTERGLLITPEYDMMITNISVEPSASPTFCRFHKINQSTYANISILSQSTFSGTDCVFPSPVEAHANTSYIIMIGKDNGALWGEKYNVGGNNNGTFCGIRQQFVFFRDFGHDFGLGSFDIRSVNYLAPSCTEIWNAYNTSCISGNHTLYYQDSAMCNTTFTLPFNNGTISSCSLSSQSNITVSLISPNGQNTNIQNYTINFTGISSINSTFACDIVVNDITMMMVNATNSTAYETNAILFNTGLNNIYINCSDIYSYAVSSTNLYTYTPTGNASGNTTMNNTLLVTFASKSILFTFTEVDAIFLIIIALLLYFPFYMNDKRWMTLYLFAGILAGVYNVYLTNKLMRIFIDDTFFIKSIEVFIFIIAGVLVLFGFLYGWEALMDMMYGSNRKKTK